MKKGTKILKTILLSGAILLGMTACGSGEKTGKNGELKQEVTISQVAGATTLDLSKATDLYSSVIFEQVFEGLTRVVVDENGVDKIVPGIADKWEKSEDQLTWTFHLRKGAKWSDGKEVTANDYKYSIMRTLNPETASQYAFILAPIENASKYNAGKISADKVGVKVVDEYTIQFKLANPTPYFLNLTAYKTFFPQRKDIVEKFGNKYGQKQESVVGNGPFKLVQWIPNNKLEFVKNDKYWDAKSVKLDKLHFMIVIDESARMNMLYNGQLDLSGVGKPEWIKKFDESGKFDATKGYAAGTNYIFFNMTDKIFKNRKVRLAFSLSVRREEMANIIFNGLFEPAYGWTPPALVSGGKEYRKEVPEPLKELKAKYPDLKKLLSEGLKELGMDPDPTHLTITYLNSSAGEFSKRYFEYIQQMWKQTLGVTVKGDFTEWSVFSKRTSERDFQIAGMGWTGDYNDPSTFMDIWASDAELYNTGFKSKEYDSLIKAARLETDLEKRTEIFAKAEKILLNDEAAIVPTVYRKKNTYIKKSLHGVVIPLFGSISFKYAYKK